jgi:hypothetical protein
MTQRGTIQVRKQDGTLEAFDVRKLAGAMWRATATGEGRYGDALELARAIEIYLVRGGRRTVTSAALFEMTLRVLRRAGWCRPAAAMEAHRTRRRVRRVGVRLVHNADQVSLWDKGWLVERAKASWSLSTSTARTIVGQIEREVLAGGIEQVHRDEVLAMLDRWVSELGLADAVPVRRP